VQRKGRNRLLEALFLCRLLRLASYTFYVARRRTPTGNEEETPPLSLPFPFHRNLSHRFSFFFASIEQPPSSYASSTQLNYVGSCPASPQELADFLPFLSLRRFFLFLFPHSHFSLSIPSLYDMTTPNKESPFSKLVRSLSRSGRSPRQEIPPRQRSRSRGNKDVNGAPLPSPSAAALSTSPPPGVSRFVVVALREWCFETDQGGGADRGGASGAWEDEERGHEGREKLCVTRSSCPRRCGGRFDSSRFIPPSF
jgi:hypothetical protein